MQVYINGSFVPKEEARISVFDHGFLYGDGVFEGIRAYHGRIFRLEQHLDRLYDSAKAISLAPPLEKKALADLCYEALRRNHLEDAYLRVIISRGEGDLGLNPRLCQHPGVVIIAGKIALYPKELYDNGMSVITAATPRTNPEALNPHIKSLNYLNNILAKIEGLEAGKMEVLMLNTQGFLAEATGDNIFIVRRGEIATPPESAGILMGVTRQVVLELAAKTGLPCRERDLNRYDLYVADECFLTGTAAEIISVTAVDGRTVGHGRPGPVTQRLQALFRELTQG